MSIPCSNEEAAGYTLEGIGEMDHQHRTEEDERERRTEEDEREHRTLNAER